MPAPRTVLMTGAAGRVGTFLRSILPEYGYKLRLFDTSPIPDEPDAITGDLFDTAALRAAARGTDAIIHLAAIPWEDRFEEILHTNIEGSYRLYEAARAEGVRRVVDASTTHVIGYTHRPRPGEKRIGTGIPLRPDSYYGVSKCFGEALASLYFVREGIETVSLRIGSCYARPTSVRMLYTWLSPADCARLMHAALTAPDVGHTIAYGASANTRGWLDLSPARRLGYQPQDDSEVFAEKLIAEASAEDAGPDTRWVGGEYPRPAG